MINTSGNLFCFHSDKRQFFGVINRAARDTLSLARKRYIGADTQRRLKLKAWILKKYMTRIYTNAGNPKASWRNRGAVGELVFRFRDFQLHRLGWVSLQKYLHGRRSKVSVTGGKRPGARGFALKGSIQIPRSKILPRGRGLYRRDNPSRPIILYRAKMMRGIFSRVEKRGGGIGRLFVRRVNRDLERVLRVISQEAKASPKRRRYA